LKANLWLASGVAATGIALPIALSYILIVLVNATPLQSFAAGAALCSTSLGTTFTVLQSTKLLTTRMGTVLSCAAMMDDVVGLVMVQVISNLGGTGASDFSAVTIVRPLLVSVGFGVAVPIFCRFIVLPLTGWVNDLRSLSADGKWVELSRRQETAFVVHTITLLPMVTASSYAGTSNLFAAYLTGAAISWWDSEVSHMEFHAEDPARQDCQHQSKAGSEAMPEGGQGQPSLSGNHSSTADYEGADKLSQMSAQYPVAASKKSTNSNHIKAAKGKQPDSTLRVRQLSHSSVTGIVIFNTYYTQPLERILKPFFFASIGFAIPIRRMFSGPVMWRGFVYAVLMTVGKLFCGLWLVRLPTPAWLRVGKAGKRGKDMKLKDLKGKGRQSEQTAGPGIESAATETKSTSSISHQAPRPAKPLSLYPSAIVGCAMVARGEIGFLISSLAESSGIYGQERNSALFLTVTWAILLCTLVGPVMVGILVKRLRRLEAIDGGPGGPGSGGGRHDRLGVWGVGAS
jgi:Kef-type K+ transport system membrane component KefB